jgi:hypothetical protein
MVSIMGSLEYHEETIKGDLMNVFSKKAIMFIRGGTDEQMTWGVHESPSSCMVLYLGRDWKNLLQKIYEYKKSKHYKFR